jgi:hypothetical protein
MIKMIIPINSLDLILMIKNLGSDTPNDDQKHARTKTKKNSAASCHRIPRL